METHKDILRILTTGSVDDGKSTLIGHLLFNCNKIYTDQLDALKKDCKKSGNEVDYAWLLDGLKAEREQGITIDVAYRYFSTAHRKFIIADTPGHEQYVRNMITGGSTADLAVILIDAQKGILTQTRRHSFLVSLLGIKHIILAVNKMDLVDYDENMFNRIVNEYLPFAHSLGLNDVFCIPLSALNGENITTKSVQMPWYKGMPFLEYIETISISHDSEQTNFRFPVQYVLRTPNSRNYCGKIIGGSVRKGDTVTLLPSKRQISIRQISIGNDLLEEAFPSQCVAISLNDEVDLSRGEMIVSTNNLPNIGGNIKAMLVWMDEQPMNSSTSFYLKHTTQITRAHITNIGYKVNVNTLEHIPTEQLSLNDIACVDINCTKPLFYDFYTINHHTGAFILIDPVTNYTSAVGMIIGASEISEPSTQEFGTCTINLSELHIEPSHHEAIEKVCEELRRKGININLIY